MKMSNMAILKKNNVDDVGCHDVEISEGSDEEEIARFAI